MNRMVIEAVAIVGLGFLGASCIIVAGGQGSSSRPSGQAIVQSVPATAPPVVTVTVPTAVSTVAPSVPTATLAPTVPARPDSKPKGVSPEARAYLDWAMPKVEVAGKAMSGLATQSDQAGRSPRLIADNEWRIKTAVALAFLKTAGQELQTYPGAITPEIKNLDGLMTGAGKDFVVVADEFAAGLDQGNVGRINTANARMNAGSQKLRDATREVEQLNSGGA